MEKIFSKASETILVVSLIVSVNSYAEMKEEISEQSLFFGCMPVKVPPKKPFLSELDWIGCIDEKLITNALERLNKKNESKWGFWNCEVKKM